MFSSFKNIFADWLFSFAHPISVCAQLPCFFLYINIKYLVRACSLIKSEKKHSAQFLIYIYISIDRYLINIFNRVCWLVKEGSKQRKWELWCRNACHQAQIEANGAQKRSSFRKHSWICANSFWRHYAFISRNGAL